MTTGSFQGQVAQPPDVPGLRVRTLLGRGGHGEVWAADDLASGERVAVKVGGAGGAAPLASEVALLCRIEHPHVVRLLRVVDLPDGASAMVLEFAAGGSLAALVARRGVLSAGEVSTLLVPLAGALEQVHRRGLVHGDLAPGNVLLAADGRPLLSDLGTARVLGVELPDEVMRWRTEGFTDPTGDAADPRAGDVWGLAAVAWFALTGGPPQPGAYPGDDPGGSAATSGAPALTRLLGECLSADPASRPEPAELARRAWDAARPVPIRLVGRPPVQEPFPGVDLGSGVDSGLAVTRPPAASRPGAPAPPAPIVVGGERGRLGVAWRALTRPVVAGGLALVGLLVVAVLTGIVAAPGERATGTVRNASPAATTTRIEAELTAALVRIGSARAEAFRTATTEPLDGVEVAGSPAVEADRRLVQRLRAAGRRLHGVDYAVSQVRLGGPAAQDGPVATVTALVGTSAHRQVRVSDGSTVTVPAEAPDRITITLARSAEGWRLRSIT